MSEQDIKPPTTNELIEKFITDLLEYEPTITNVLGTKYGVSAQEFMAKCVSAIKKDTNLLKCSQESLFGSIIYFAQVGLPFNTPEGFGYITTEKLANQIEAVPIIGYKGLVEIAYRNTKLKSLRIQAVYEKDEFNYEYGTNEYLSHKPYNGVKGKLTCVYAIAQLEGINPLFVVVNKVDLDKIQKNSKSKNDAYANNDVFNILQAKVPLKLLFKTLPKTDNEALIKALELDNKFDYEKNVKIVATPDGFELVEVKAKSSAMTDNVVEPIEIKIN